MVARPVARLTSRRRSPRPTLARWGAVAAIVLAAACSAHRPIKTETASLRVGTSGDYPPFSVHAADGTWSGFDVEVARAYAAARGRRLELVPFRWADLATRVAAGDFDAAMSGITVRADRLLVGTLTAAVARAEAVVLVRRGDPPRDGLDRAGVRIAVNRGGHLERVARDRLAHATLVTIDDNRRLPAMLADREVEAIVSDTLEAATFDPSAFVIAARWSRDRKAYWVAPGRDALADDLDAWLLARERDGMLPRLRAERLVGDTTPATSPELARVADLAARRLLLMPEVAAAKHAAGLPIVDAPREAAVITRAVERARAAGLDAAGAEHLARAEIGAARAVQEATRSAPTPRPPDAPTLATLRPRIDALDTALLRAITVARGAAVKVERGPLAAALRADADIVGFDEAHAGAVAAALAEVLRPDAGRP